MNAGKSFDSFRCICSFIDNRCWLFGYADFDGSAIGVWSVLATDFHGFGMGTRDFCFVTGPAEFAVGGIQPFVGAIADKYGSGRTVATGGLIYALGVYLMSGVESPVILHMGNMLVGFGLSGTALAVVLGVMVRAVSAEKRSFVLGIGTAASSLGQFTMIPLGQLFISTYGWSTALLLISICCMIMVPCAVKLTGRSSTDAIGQVNLNLRQALAEAFGHRGYLLLVTGFFVCGFHVAFIATHLPAYIVDEGFPANLGAWALALVGLFNIIGCLTSGYWEDAIVRSIV